MKSDFVKNSSLALTAGVLIAVMVTVNGMLAATLGTGISLVVIHLVGLMTAGVALVIKKSTRNIIKGVPFGYLLGGAVGVITVLLNNICVNNIGVTMTLGLVLVGQIIASAIVEHFGLLGMQKKKISFKKAPAYILMIAGAVIMIVWS